MGVVKRAGSKFLWMVYTDPAGVRHWESTLQTDRRSAEEVLASTLAGLTGKGKMPERGPMTIGRWGQIWLDETKGRGLETFPEYKQRVNDYIVPAIGHIALADWNSRHSQEFVRGLKKIISKRTKKPLSPRSIRHVYAALRLLNRAAVADGRMEHNACVLKRGDLPPKADSDPLWRELAVFSHPEVELMISQTDIPLDRRVWYALHFLTGMRPGEGSAILWRDYDTRAKPLGRLTVSKASDRKRKIVRGTKTGVVRRLPVHPALASILAEWRLSGWAEMMGRKPELDDLIIPSRRGASRSNSLVLKRFNQDLKRAGLRKRRAYDSRRTFVSLAQGDGARRDVVDWLTHPPRDQLAEYTTLPWATLCEAVSCLKLERLSGRMFELRREAIRAESQEAGMEDVTASVTVAQEQEKTPGSRDPGATDLAGCTGLEAVPDGAAKDRRASGVRDLKRLRAEHGLPERENRVGSHRALSHCHAGPGGRPRALAVAVRTRGRT